MPLKVKLWGVRGSLPTPTHPDDIVQRLIQAIDGYSKQPRTDVASFVEALPISAGGGYGGNTACVQVSSAKQDLIIDAGSGLRGLGDVLMRGPCGQGKGKVHLFFTHFHWDHVIGLPFFVPIFIPGNEIHIHAVQPELEDCVRQIFKKPFFPVPFEGLRSKIEFHRLEPRHTIEVGDVTVAPYQLDHPDPCWGFRVESGGKAYAHCVDTEGTRMSEADLGADLPLYRNADLVLFDAQYTLIEAVEKMNWGHSAALIGIDIALRENIKQILFAHHDPGASDEKIADAQRQTEEYVQAFRAHAKVSGRSLPTLKWGFAREGQVIDL